MAESAQHGPGNDMLTRQRHQMAEGGRGVPAQTFGISDEGLKAHGPSMGPCNAEMLSESERGVGPAFRRGEGQMHGQRMPDHGKHRHRA
jgi:hypothetical protein